MTEWCRRAGRSIKHFWKCNRWLDIARRQLEILFLKFDTIFAFNLENNEVPSVEIELFLYTRLRHRPAPGFE